MEALCILPGTDKDGKAEGFAPVTLRRGEMTAVVGGTGSGKSRLIKDIEQLVRGDSVTRRTVLLDGEPVKIEERMGRSTRLIAHLGQSMRFVLDAGVAEFLTLHMGCRGKGDITPEEVIALANSLTPEPITAEQNLTTLSGGQTRALMIADVALICQSPVVLVDEIENAGVDKRVALDALTGRDKILLVVTHDPHTALLCGSRIRLHNGAVVDITKRTQEEERLLAQLEQQYTFQGGLQNRLRRGERLI